MTDRLAGKAALITGGASDPGANAVALMEVAMAPIDVVGVDVG